MRTTRLLIVALSLAVGLSSCGSGGGDDPETIITVWNHPDSVLSIVTVYIYDTYEAKLQTYDGLLIGPASGSEFPVPGRNLYNVEVVYEGSVSSTSSDPAVPQLGPDVAAASIVFLRQ